MPADSMMSTHCRAWHSRSCGLAGHAAQPDLDAFKCRFRASTGPTLWRASRLSGASQAAASSAACQDCTGHALVRHTSCTTSEQAAWVYDGLRWRCRLRRAHPPFKQKQRGRLHPPSPAPHLLQVHLLGPGSQMKAWVADSHGAACVQVGLRGVFRVATGCSG